MRKYLFALGLLFASLCASAPAHAVACSGTSVHGSGNHACYAIAPGTWGTTTVWSATSGGGSCGCTIATGDELIFDAATPAGTYTWNTTSLVAVDASAAGAGVIISGAAGPTITGNFFAVSTAATFTATGSWTFTSTTGTTTITLNGHTFQVVTFNGAGGTFQPVGTFAATTLTLTNGTFDAATNNVAVNLTASLSLGAGTKTLNCGTGIWTISGPTAATWDTTTNAAGLTMNCTGNALRLVTTSPTGFRQMNVASGQSLGAITISGATTPSYPFEIIPTGPVTFASLTLTGPLFVAIQANFTITLSATPTWTGTSTAPIGIVVNGIANNTPSTFAIPASPAPSLSWMSFQNIIFTGNTAGVCNNCFDYGRNTGMTFNPPGGGGRIIGG